MQKNQMSLKRKLLIDGNELAGLVECGGVNDEDQIIDVPGFNRLSPIKSGVKKLEPFPFKYAIKRGTNTHQVLHDWHFDDELHDVTLINTDASGTEINRWLLRDCELPKFDEPTYNAGQPEYYFVSGSFICPTDPKLL